MNKFTASGLLLASLIFNTVGVPALHAQIKGKEKQKEEKPSPTTALGESEEVVELSPFEVTAEMDRGYTAASTTAGSRLSSSLKETPAVVGVMTKEFLDDIGATDIATAAQWGSNIYTPGTEDAGYQNYSPNVTFRGIGGTFNALARNYFIGYVPPDIFETERVELSHGPNAALYGDGALGGLTSATTKRAKPNENFRRLTLQTNSDSSFRTSVDVNASKGPVALRVNGLFQRNHGWRDDDFDNADGVHIAATWKVAKNTRLRGEFAGGTKDRLAPPENYIDQISSWNHTFTYAAPSATTPTGAAAAGVAGASNNLDYIVYQSGAGERGLQNWKNTGRSIGIGAAIYPYEDANDAIYPGLKNRISLPSRQFNLQAKDTPMSELDYQLYGVYLEQTLFNKLVIEVADFYQYRSIDISRFYHSTLYYDVNQTRPDGSANPYLGHIYSDTTSGKQNTRNWTNDARLMAAYPIKIGIMEQRVVFVLGQRDEMYTNIRSQLVRTNGANPSIITSANQVYIRRYLDVSTDSLGDPVSSNGMDIASLPIFHQKQKQLTRYAQVGAVGRYWDGKFNTIASYRRDRYQQDVTDHAVGRAITATQAPVPVWRSQDPVRNASLDPKQHYPNGFDIDSASLGAVYFPIKPVGVFINYSSGFNSFGGNSDIWSNAASPPVNKGLDIGLKLELFNGKISGTVNRYQSYHSGDGAPSQIGNINTIWNTVRASYRAAATVAANAGDHALASDLNSRAATADAVQAKLPSSYLDSQTTHANGWEMDITANITKNWRAIFNVAKTDNEITDALPDTKTYYNLYIDEWRSRLADPNTNVTALGNAISSIQTVFANTADGRRVIGTPDYTANVYTTYRIPSGMLRGLKFGGGVQFQGPRVIAANQIYNSTTNTYSVSPDQEDLIYSQSTVIASAMIAYERKFFGKPWSIQLNVDNLFDNDQMVYTAVQTYTYTDSNNVRHGQLIPSRFRYVTPLRLTLRVSLGF